MKTGQGVRASRFSVAGLNRFRGHPRPWEDGRLPARRAFSNVCRNLWDASIRWLSSAILSARKASPSMSSSSVAASRLRRWQVGSRRQLAKRRSSTGVHGQLCICTCSRKVHEHDRRRFHFDDTLRSGSLTALKRQRHPCRSRVPLSLIGDRLINHGPLWKSCTAAWATKMKGRNGP